MKRLLIGVLVGLAVGATGAPADDARQAIIWPAAAQLNAARLGVGQLAESFSPPHAADARRRIYDCGRSRCDFRIRGTSDCRGTVHTRFDPSDGGYWYWVSGLRCR